jgi:hypothetical protein
MRKGIRKLNKVIYKNFKKEMKEIKMTVLYKIIEATDKKYRNCPNIEVEISNRSCSNR